ncbi:MAG: 30S ribosomal protein S9 [Bacteroidia bacterium]|nr:30S ribosomal protein S9 [Bacteroidia bacterium]
MDVINRVGKRKTAVARLYIKPGAGSFKINGVDFKDYVNTDLLRLKVLQPFQVLSLDPASFDIYVNVYGGGTTGQAEAIRLAISRAFALSNPEEYRPPLKKAGFLTRDARSVERKKYGHKKARKNFQFSKR